MLRHGRIWRGGSTWTFAHERWLTSQRFDDPALATTYAHYRATLQARDAALDAIEADLTSWYDQPPFADAVPPRLAAYRASPAWAPSPWPARSATGAGSHRTPVHGVLRVDPERVLQRQLDLAGSHHHARQRPSGAQLVESAWAYQHRPQVTLELRRRQAGLPPEVVARAWTAQLRLCARFRRLHARKQCRQVVVIAVARELAGFLWAEMAA